MRGVDHLQHLQLRDGQRVENRAGRVAVAYVLTSVGAGIVAAAAGWAIAAAVVCSGRARRPRAG